MDGSRHLGIDLKDVLAFGDQTNDIEMLTLCGMGIAMANTRKNSVKAAADRVLGPSNQFTAAVYHTRLVCVCARVCACVRAFQSHAERGIRAVDALLLALS